MSSATSRKSLSHRRRSTAPTLSGERDPQRSDPRHSPTQTTVSSPVGPQPARRRRRTDGAKHWFPPVTHTAATTCDTASEAGCFDFGLNSIGIPTGCTPRRLNSVPAAPTTSSVNDGSRDRTAQTAARHGSVTEMSCTPRRQSGHGVLPCLPSTLSRTSLSSGNPNGFSGSYTTPGSLHDTASASTLQTRPSLLMSLSSPAAAASMHPATLSGAQPSVFFNSSGQWCPANPCNSFLTPAGLNSVRADFNPGNVPSSTASSSSESSVVLRDLSVLGPNSASVDSRGCGGSVPSSIWPTSAYDVLGSSATVTGSCSGNLMQSHGWSLMRPAGTGGFGVGYVTPTSVYRHDSGCRRSQLLPLSPHARQGRRTHSFAASASNVTPADRSMLSISAGGFHPALAHFHEAPQPARIIVAGTPMSYSTSHTTAKDIPLSSSVAVTRWVKPKTALSSPVAHSRRTSSLWKNEVSRGLAEFSSESAATLAGLDYMGTAAACVGVPSFTIIEHQHAAPSDRARVRSTDGRTVEVTQHGDGCLCTTDECLWRPCGSRGLSSVLVTDAASRFAVEGENSFLWVLDCPADPTHRAADSKTRGGSAGDLAASLCRVAVEAAVSAQSPPDTAIEMMLTAIAYTPPARADDSSWTRRQTSLTTGLAQFTDLLASPTPTRSRQSLEVATSPITGSCVDGCVGVPVASVSAFDDLAHQVQQNAADAVAEESIVMWQLTLLSSAPSWSVPSSVGEDDVVLSSFTVASTTCPALLERLLDHGTGTQWALFKYGLGLGPCNVMTVLRVGENESEAATLFSAVERLRYRGHCGPRQGSVRGWLKEANDHIAELGALDDVMLMEAVCESGPHQTIPSTAHIRERLRRQCVDFQSFLRRPSLDKAPLYAVDATAAQSGRALCVDEADTATKLSAVPPFTAAFIRRREDAPGLRMGVRALVEALSDGAVTVRQRNRPGMLFGRFEELCVTSEATPALSYAEAVTRSEALTQLESHFLDGFNTCVLGVSPIALTPEKSDSTRRTTGSAPGEEAAMPGVTMAVGRAVRAVFEKVEKQRGDAVLRCCVSVYHVRDANVVDLLDGERKPTFSPLTVVASPLLGYAPNLVTQRSLANEEDYAATVREGLGQLQRANQQLEEADKEYLSYTVISVELKQVRRSDPDDVFVSVMTGISLGENYNVLSDPSFFYEKAHPGAPCVLLLKGCLTQCARSLCVAFIDEAATMEVATLLGRVRDMKRMEAQPIVVGSTKRLVQRLTKVRVQLQGRRRSTKRVREHLSRVEGMLNDAARLLENPRTTDAVYYLRSGGGADDNNDDVLDQSTTATEGRRKRRGNQVVVTSPATVPPSGCLSDAAETPERADQTAPRGRQPDTAAHVAAPYEAALAACHARSTHTVRYYGTRYRRDPALRPPSSPAEHLHVPSVILLRHARAVEAAGIAPRNSVEVPAATSTSREVVTVTDQEGVNSALLTCHVTCATAGYASAVILVDTDALTSAASLSWATARHMCTRFWSALAEAPNVPHVLHARAVFLSASAPNSMVDLLDKDTKALEGLKYSPLCGPVSKDAATMPVRGVADVDALMQRLHSTLVKLVEAAGACREVRGAVAVQLVAHQFVTGTNTDGSDKDVRLGCLWVVCGDGYGDWLSATTAQPSSSTARLLDFWLGGPCFTTSVLAVTPPPPNGDDVNLRHRFDHLVKVQEALSGVALRTPRNGSVARYEAYLQDTRARGGGTGPSPRLTALISEAAQLRQKSHDHFTVTGKVPGLLAHDSKVFTMMDE